MLRIIFGEWSEVLSFDNTLGCDSDKLFATFLCSVTHLWTHVKLKLCLLHLDTYRIECDIVGKMHNIPSSKCNMGNY